MLVLTVHNPKTGLIKETVCLQSRYIVTMYVYVSSYVHLNKASEVGSQITLLRLVWSRVELVLYSLAARASKALTICLTTSSKNTVAKCE